MMLATNSKHSGDRGFLNSDRRDHHFDLSWFHEYGMITLTYNLEARYQKLLFNALSFRQASSLPRAPLISLEDISKTEETSFHAQARSWVAQFRDANLSKSDVDFTFSRSSGPGGQVRRVFVASLYSQPRHHRTSIK